MTLATTVSIDAEIAILEKLIDDGKVNAIVTICLTTDGIIHMMTQATPLPTVKIMLENCNKAVVDMIGEDQNDR